MHNGEKVKVKISGDGATVTRKTSFVVLSFSVVDSDDILSSKGYYNCVTTNSFQDSIPIMDVQ